MRPGVCRNPGNVMPAFTTYSRLQQEMRAGGREGTGKGVSA